MMVVIFFWSITFYSLHFVRLNTKYVSLCLAILCLIYQDKISFSYRSLLLIILFVSPLLLISIESHHLLIEHDVMSDIMQEDNVSLFKDYWYCLDNSEEHVYINFMSSLLRLHSRY
ncbi:hypothetical protein PHYBLDRAFT_61374 [Phycomyces blakesleeanus NRRL 1555(-)]|uniref:Uncharacterized protein n=1 Tax=Phycomyces blakesleeanus (strain ATCC 8743b / DSM 1359 / FGSC 10004 / NBRC 33097 / NRRL 1555) TaxID=763407 RepID=A0A162YF88_PHYB8|nr:hypothetical protein PHYBLDRAFT_61374 [Phycomyces blakesleeanus NRRL 1555(-)]OAD80325.1 hypothetical protein PHYBLDRAFT_61374 [Phycomyces blakesleeanus NRRL 1555(-)]|eukprot:XP_018298365.1 hypothetical protein PHYBLDRAFT_61374 [Phycomyces blakesleeanus NRRL 1555(-)]